METKSQVWRWLFIELGIGALAFIAAGFFSPSLQLVARTASACALFAGLASLTAVHLGYAHGTNGLFAGIAIGLVLTLIHLVGIPVTNTSVNPARSIGPAVFVGGWALAQLWLFIVAPLIGAAAAAGVYLGLGATQPLLTAREAEQALPGEQAERAT